MEYKILGIALDSTIGGSYRASKASPEIPPCIEPIDLQCWVCLWKDDVYL